MHYVQWMIEQDLLLLTIQDKRYVKTLLSDKVTDVQQPRYMLPIPAGYMIIV